MMPEFTTARKFQAKEKAYSSGGPLKMFLAE